MKHTATVSEIIQAAAIETGIHEWKDLALKAGIPETTLGKRKKLENGWSIPEIRACEAAIKKNGGRIDQKKLGAAILAELPE